MTPDIRILLQNEAVERFSPKLTRFALLALLLIAPASAQNPDRLRPTFPSEVLPAEEALVMPLLTAVCGDGVRTVDPAGHKALGCGDGDMDEILATRNRLRRYPWMPYTLWEADGVIFGHFLSPTSEDAAMNCSACGSHPNLYGGSVLLSKKSGRWEPIWFRYGVVVRHCRKITLATGRQILFCEEPDAGMGHAIHGLYTVDFTRPKFAWDSVVLMADSYADPWLGGVQAQLIDGVQFDERGRGQLMVRVLARHGRVKLPSTYPGKTFPRPRLSRYEIGFRLEGEGFKLTPETVAAGRLFDLGSQ